MHGVDASYEVNLKTFPSGVAPHAVVVDLGRKQFAHIGEVQE
jgi:hypothetical protein